MFLSIKPPRPNRELEPTVGPVYPEFGLVRIQWDGPWCKPGVPIGARYRKTHWIACRIRDDDGETQEFFDINAMNATGGWLHWYAWTHDLVPWILGQCVPKANGRWWPTHCWEIDRV